MFSHISDLPPCREQFWDKSSSHGFHDLQLRTLYLAWINCLRVQSMRENAFFMVFHVSESHLRDSGGIRRLVVSKIHIAWKSIQNAYLLSFWLMLSSSMKLMFYCHTINLIIQNECAYSHNCNLLIRNECFYSHAFNLWIRNECVMVMIVTS